MFSGLLCTVMILHTQMPSSTLLCNELVQIEPLFWQTTDFGNR